MITKELTIQNKLGLHTRAASKWIDQACRYLSDIRIEFNNKEIDAKSIMHVMTIGIRHGDTFSLSIDGDDQEAALDALEALVNNRFGEQE